MKTKNMAIAVLAATSLLTSSASSFAAGDETYKASVESWKAANKAAKDHLLALAKNSCSPPIL